MTNVLFWAGSTLCFYVFQQHADCLATKKAFNNQWMNRVIHEESQLSGVLFLLSIIISIKKIFFLLTPSLLQTYQKACLENIVTSINWACFPYTSPTKRSQISNVASISTLGYLYEQNKKSTPTTQTRTGRDYYFRRHAIYPCSQSEKDNHSKSALSSPLSWEGGC